MGGVLEDAGCSPVGAAVADVNLLSSLQHSLQAFVVYSSCAAAGYDAFNSVAAEFPKDFHFNTKAHYESPKGKLTVAVVVIVSSMIHSRWFISQHKMVFFH